MHISARSMVSKHNNHHFAHNGRENQLQQRSIGNHNNVRASIAPYRKPYKSQACTLTGIEMSFSASCQMPSDPLYIDFNNPTPMPQNRQNAGSKNAGAAAGKAQQMPKRKGPKGKQRPLGSGCGVGDGVVKQQHSTNSNWHPKHRNHVTEQQRFNGAGVGLQRGGIYNGSPNPQLLTGPPNRGVGGGRVILPPPPMGMRVGPMPPRPPMGYQPVPPPSAPLQPMRGRMPPLGMLAPPLPPPPHFMRRNGVGGPMPSMAPLMCGPRMPVRGLPPHMPHFNAASGGGVGNPCFGNNNMHTHGSNLNNSGKIKKPNAHLVKQAVKGKSTIKTLKTLVNQYPIDKPWVNDAIRGEHTKKVDIENRLKGNKDDELFAQFKVQRDKFVALYEAARELYLKQEAANVMSAKDAKDKESITNKNANTAVKVGNGKAAIPNPNVKRNNQTNLTKSAGEKNNNAAAQQQQQQQQELA